MSKAIVALAFVLGGWAGAEELPLKGLSKPVEVYFDNHGIPHIYAQSWPDAARALGYLHASERLWQMDMFRRTASGTQAEVLGRDALRSDILVRQLGIRRGCQAMWDSDKLPKEFRAEVEAYTDGVNQRLAALGTDNLPAMFKSMGYAPEPWTPVDSLVFGKYMGWDQSGTETDLWLGMLVEKLGPDKVNELWPLDRPYESPQIKHHVNRDRLGERVKRASLEPVPGASPAYAAAIEKLQAATWLGRGGAFGSNNWAVAGVKTASGKPMLCSDPHLGFNLPSIWYAAHLSVGDENVAGVTFPGSPVVIIGHNDRIAWGITNMQTDTVDYFVETLNPENPAQYRHRGEWKELQRIVESVPVKGEAPHELVIESTVHGPIISREGRVISLQWVGLGPTTDTHALWRVNRARNLKEYLAALDLIVTPALNMVYADADGNIALHSCGAHPLRLPGEGRIPMDGASGEHDWRGYVPREELPLSVNPPEGYVASANARVAPVGYPHYLGWMWDPSYRMRRLDDLLSAADDLTIDRMKSLQTDAHDKAAEVFVPVLVSILKGAKLGKVEKRALEELERWDYTGRPEAIAPILWARWLDAYRHAVWDDEWESRGIEQPGGSWGYTGDNRREPPLEILEYLTREQPESRWFDVQGTAEVETRDALAVRAFQEAVARIGKERGDDMANWAWGNFNVLRVPSMAGVAELDRDGGPFAGLTFTVNPGGEGSTVTGGASWRMIVDLGDPAASVGVYPGGQSGDPESPFYDDLIKLWASGQYVPIHMVGDPAELPGQARVRQLTLKPE